MHAKAQQVQQALVDRGVTMTDGRAGLEMVKPDLAHELIDGQAYWFPPAAASEKGTSPSVYLLPNFDEYVVSYTDRGAIFDTAHTSKLNWRDNPLFSNVILVDGEIAGTWKRTARTNTVAIEANPFTMLNNIQSRALTDAAERYGAFLALPLRLSMNT